MNANPFSACIAHLLGRPRGDLTEGSADGPAEIRGWLAARNLGLVPVRDPAGFTWPGPFLARVGEPTRWVVMFGVPPGVLFDPSGAPAPEVPQVEEAWVLAPLSGSVPTGESPYGPATTTEGRVEAIVIAPGAEATAETVERATAIAGRGLEGDRYAAGSGTFSSGPGNGRALTLIEAEALDETNLTPAAARRNVITRGIPLNPLVGRPFKIGEVECIGRRLCQPCAHLERLTETGVLRALVDRGGLRADIVSGGAIRVGDIVTSR